MEATMNRFVTHIRELADGPTAIGKVRNPLTGATMSRPMVDHVAQRERRLDELIQRLGIDLSRFTRADHGATYAKAKWNCVRCRNPNACIEWSKQPAAATRAPPVTCPNHELICSYLKLP